MVVSGTVVVVSGTVVVVSGTVVVVSGTVVVVVVDDGGCGQFVLPKYCCAVDGNSNGPWIGPPGLITGGVDPVSTSNWAGVHPLANRKVVVPGADNVVDLTPASVCGHWIPRCGMA